MKEEILLQNILNSENFSFEKARQVNSSAFGLEEFPFKTTLSFAPMIEYWEKKLESQDRGESLISQEIVKLLENAPEFRSPINDFSLLDDNDDLVELLLTGFFPGAERSRQLGSAIVPFNIHGFYYTPRLNKLLQNSEVKVTSNLSLQNAKSLSIVRACAMILNKYYNQEINIDPPFVYIIKPKNGSLQKLYKSVLNIDYVEIRSIGELPKIEQNQINELLLNVYDYQSWLRVVPPSSFSFEGLVSVNLIDVTEEETLSLIKNKLLEKNALLEKGNLPYLNELVSNYFGLENLMVGYCSISFPPDSGSYKYKIKNNILGDKFPSVISKEYPNTVYEKACRQENVLMVEDLHNVEDPTIVEVELLNKKIQSIAIKPMKDDSGRIIGLLEIGSERPYDMNALTEMKMKDLSSLFRISFERTKEEIENRIQAVITKHYTNIHPSVEWKFIETSLDYLDRLEKEGPDAFILPIMFHDVYPLYGQADIVGSTNIRNNAIQADFLENLQLIEKVFSITQKITEIPLIDRCLMDIEKFRKKIILIINPDDESKLFDLITKEVHPLMEQIKDKNPRIWKVINDYYSKLDPETGLVFHRRKAYEESLMIINETIMQTLEGENEIAQEMMPHYFDKYKTDGLEFNMYAGQSLLRKERFSNIHLRNLRLWQFQLLCKISLKVHELQAVLPVSLTTAQMIFVYPDPINIKFRTDEKRFDVEGANNVRYEIIKKRIDKVHIADTKERLTKSGKISIVYMNEKDKLEYLDYIYYLVNKGYLTDTIEELPLEKLQGVQGLQALRVTINVENDELSGEDVDKQINQLLTD